MHFVLDSHDSYTSTDDNEDRMVPNPAKAKAYQKVVAARNAHTEAAAIAETNLMALKTPADGSTELAVIVTSAMHSQAMAPLWEAENALIAAEKAHKAIPAKLRLGELNPGQQVLAIEVKLTHTGIRMAAYNTAMTIVREIRTNTGYRRANQEAHTLMRQIFNQPGDSDTTKPGHLMITLDPLPTNAKTAAAAQLNPDLSIRPPSQDAYSDVRPIRKRQRPPPHQRLLYSTNLLLRGYDTATHSNYLTMTGVLGPRIPHTTRSIHQATPRQCC